MQANLSQFILFVCMCDFEINFKFWQIAVLCTPFALHKQETESLLLVATGAISVINLIQSQCSPPVSSPFPRDKPSSVALLIKSSLDLFISNYLVYKSKETMGHWLAFPKNLWQRLTLIWPHVYFSELNKNSRQYIQRRLLFPYQSCLHSSHW